MIGRIRSSDDRAARERLGVSLSRLRLRDILSQAVLSIARSPARSLATALGTVIGAAAFVATMGISATTTNQVGESFDLQRATEVLIRPASDATDPAWSSPNSLARVRGLVGVAHAGRRLSVGDVPTRRSLDGNSRTVNVLGADPGALAAMAPHVVAGRTYDEFHERSAAPVVLLSSGTAQLLGVLRPGSAIFIDDKAYTVAGIFDDVQRRPEALTGLLMPASSAVELLGSQKPESQDVLIETRPGAAQVVAAEAQVALLPTAPSSLVASAPPDPRLLRRLVESDLQLGSLGLSLVALVVGGLVIGNSAAAAVATRAHEIGLRRALGARSKHILTQLLGETTVLGLAGGIVGVAAGIVVTAAVALAHRWEPVLSIGPAALAVVASTGIGLAAGIWPGLRAMRIQPVVALAR